MEDEELASERKPGHVNRSQRKKEENNMMNKNNDCFHVERLEKRFDLSEMLLICLLCRKLTHIDAYKLTFTLTHSLAHISYGRLSRERKITMQTEW